MGTNDIDLRFKPNANRSILRVFFVCCKSVNESLWMDQWCSMASSMHLIIISIKVPAGKGSGRIKREHQTYSFFICIYTAFLRAPCTVCWRQKLHSRSCENHMQTSKATMPKHSNYPRRRVCVFGGHEHRRAYVRFVRNEATTCKLFTWRKEIINDNDVRTDTHSRHTQSINDYTPMCRAFVL